MYNKYKTLFKDLSHPRIRTCFNLQIIKRGILFKCVYISIDNEKLIL